MKILHTSDWHLGRSLYGRKRYDEFAAFLDWLVRTIEDEGIDVLLVAGDVFDSSTPGNRAQELYYRFLCRVANSCCRHVVVIAGNHDSPSFLNAPKELLRALNVHVIGAVTEDPEDEVLVIDDVGSEHADTGERSGQLEIFDSETGNQKSAIICAVPYLRDKDIRTVEPGETIDDKNRKLIEGIKAHYAQVIKIAEQKRNELLQQSKITNQKSDFQNQQSPIPVIAMGHLFTASGKTVEGDGVRELYVGSLAHVSKDVFPSSIDYFALGHLHTPQTVGETKHIRYSGSPIPMGYGEANQEKKVVIVEFNPQKEPRMDTNRHKLKEIIRVHSCSFVVHEKVVPCFQQLVRIVGSLDDIHAKVEALKKKESRAWLEIEYTGGEVIGNLRDMLDEALSDTAMEILRIKNKRATDRVIGLNEEETLDDLDTGDVFTRCLDAFDVPDEDREELNGAYNEVVRDVLEEDRDAE